LPSGSLNVRQPNKEGPLQRPLLNGGNVLLIEFLSVQTLTCSACGWRSITTMPNPCLCCGHHFKRVKLLFIDGATLYVDVEGWERATS